MTIGTSDRPLRVAVVGAGPAGFYATAALLDADMAVEVDLIDRLPTPFGLVRGGVAPDHQKIKRVTAAYERTAGDPSFRFFGNVELGRDVTVAQLRDHYDQVCLCVGTQGGRPLRIPGVDLEGSVPAPEFVFWYNAHPDHAQRTYDLGCSAAVVVGVGNVAVDVARVLSRSPDELAVTDIGSNALRALRSSAIRDVYVLGRRGPVQAAFSTSELRDLASLDGVDIVVPEWSASVDPHSQAWLEAHGARADHAKVALIRELATREPTGAPRRLHLWMTSSPVALLGEGRVSRVRVERNALVADDKGRIRPKGTGQITEIDAGLVVAAVGYRGEPLPGLPFDPDWGIIPNEGGRVMANGAVVPGTYVAGWAKRGPSGVIGTNKADAQLTVQAMLEDLAAGRVPEVAHPSGDAAHRLLAGAVKRVFAWSDWRALDALELAVGAEQGRVRQKFESIEAMEAAVE